jgi:myosin-crossreactive antigen
MGEISAGRPERQSIRIQPLHSGPYRHSFTGICRDSRIFEQMEAFSGNKPGPGGLVAFKDSRWVVLYHQPRFVDQPRDVQVFWCYAVRSGADRDVRNRDQPQAGE